jgi:Putative adhesin
MYYPEALMHGQPARRPPSRPRRFDATGSRALAAALALPACLAAAACGFGPLPGRATEEWTRTYPLAAGGEVRIGNTNGKVEIEGVDGANVEVRAEKIARAATDDAARQLLPRITINEDVKPDRVSIETARIAGVMIGAGFEVQYHIKAPKGAVINARTTNGGVMLTGLSGKVYARTTNGGVRATALSGPVEAASTNGGVNIDLASVGAEKIALRTTNGGVTLQLPETAKADVVATWTNGGMSVDGLTLDVSERSRRRFEGKMNGGGTSIELHTTNGGIRLRARDAETQK